MIRNHEFRSCVTALIAACCAASAPAGADVVTEWNAKAAETVAAAKTGTPIANRTMAIVQTAVYEAVQASANSSPEAAVAAANRAVLSTLVPSQKEAIDGASQKTVAATPASLTAKRLRRK